MTGERGREAESQRWKGAAAYQRASSTLRQQGGCSWEGRRTGGGRRGPKAGHTLMRCSGARSKGAVWRQCWGRWAVGWANRSGESSLTDVGVAGDLAKDVCLPPRGLSHLLQLLRTQPLGCHLHDLHCKLLASSPMNTAADHRAHSSARVGQHMSQGLLPSRFHTEWSLGSLTSSAPDSGDPARQGDFLRSSPWPTGASQQPRSETWAPSKEQHRAHRAGGQGSWVPGSATPSGGEPRH